MEIKVALIKNENQFIFANFSAENSGNTTISDLADLKDCKADLILFPEETESEELIVLLTEEHRFRPVRPQEEIGITEDNFANFSYEELEKSFHKINEAWVLQNNLDLLETLFPVTNHLKEIWPNDRSSFFEELWFILRRNIGTTDLKIVFNNIRLAEKDHEKNKLVRSRVEGFKYPETFPGGEFENKVIESYKTHFSPNLELCEYDQDRGELVATVSIKDSPVVIMAKVNNISRLQITLLKTFFDGVQ